MKKIFFLLLIISAFTETGCIKEVTPSNSINSGSFASNVTSLSNAVNGGYSLFKPVTTDPLYSGGNNWYLRQYFQMSDFASDDIVNAQPTTDELELSFTLQHTVVQTNSRDFWLKNYQIISGMNTVIAGLQQQTNLDPTTSQLLGEAYFLRAFCHFNLSKFYGLPYSINPNAPCIILRQSTTDSAIKARSTVQQVYNAIIADAKKAASLMNQPRGVMYASKEAAEALLSRVYLYEGNADSTIYYSNQVINSGRFQLETTDAFPNLFINAANEPETIFCIAMGPLDDLGKFGSISSMLYTNGNSGWGEELVSLSYRKLLDEHPEDVRHHFVLHDTIINDGYKNGIAQYFVTKFSNPSSANNPTLTSPIMFRLAEMYLNRAEAYAIKSDITNALADVDMIRKNRGLSTYLYNGAVPSGMSLLDVVLNERRLELAFEGHRTFDVYRNKRDMNREYWGYHLLSYPVQTDPIPDNPAPDPSVYPNALVSWQNPRIIYFIPIDEINTNPLCTQNP